MKKAYRFDDSKPKVGHPTHAFRTLNGLKKFAKIQGTKGNMKFWEINGTIISDDRSEDGILIKVVSVKQVL